MMIQKISFITIKKFDLTFKDLFRRFFYKTTKKIFVIKILHNIYELSNLWNPVLLVKNKKNRVKFF